jgi:large conductance mechanosensitive channel
VLLKYGVFIQTVLEFLIIAFALFVVIKAINRLKRPSPSVPVPPTKTEALLEDIRNLLTKK